MVIDWENKTYSLDFAAVTVRQCEVIEQASGLTIGDWLDLFGETPDGGPDFGASHPRFLQTLKILYWLMLDQNGEQVPIAVVDFPVLAFGEAFAAALVAEAAQAPPAAEEPPDPTRGGRSPVTASRPRTRTGSASGGRARSRSARG